MSGVQDGARWMHALCWDAADVYTGRGGCGILFWATVLDAAYVTRHES